MIKILGVGLADYHCIQVVLVEHVSDIVFAVFLVSKLRGSENQHGVFVQVRLQCLGTFVFIWAVPVLEILISRIVGADHELLNRNRQYQKDTQCSYKSF